MRPTLLVSALTVLSLSLFAAPDWVTRSNENAQVLLQVMAKFQPEQAAAFGVTGIDTQVSDRSPGYRERYQAAMAGAQAELRKRLAAEKDALVKQDLEILIQSEDNEALGQRLQRKLMLPYQNIAGQVYGGLRVT